MTLPFSLDRTVLIRARRATVFRYFTDSERFAAWWGAGSSIDARPGGAVRIVYPNGVVALGQVLEVFPGEGIVFSYGYEDPGKPIAPGGSRVTVRLDERPDGTLVRLRHDVGSADLRDSHAPGWRFQLSLFALAVAREAEPRVEAAVDDWFRAFNEPDAAARLALLERIAAPEVTFRDRYACIEGRDDLDGHIAALHRFLPAAALAREGAIRHCQGHALVGWSAGAARGDNLFELDADGKIASVVGFWS